MKTSCITLRPAMKEKIMKEISCRPKTKKEERDRLTTEFTNERQNAAVV